jgi:hypothetical protein
LELKDLGKVVFEYTQCKDFKVELVDEILFGKYANTFKYFAQMKKEYRHQLLEVAKFNRIDLEVSCSSNRDIEEDATYLILSGEFTIYEEETYTEKKKLLTRRKHF